MSVIHITCLSDNFFILITEKGKEIGIGIDENRCSIFIKANGLGRISMGRHFHGSEPLLQAVDAYKATDIKEAIRSLVSHLAYDRARRESITAPLSIA